MYFVLFYYWYDAAESSIQLLVKESRLWKLHRKFCWLPCLLVFLVLILVHLPGEKTWFKNDLLGLLLVYGYVAFSFTTNRKNTIKKISSCQSENSSYFDWQYRLFTGVPDPWNNGILLLPVSPISRFDESVSPLKSFRGKTSEAGHGLGLRYIML